MPETSEKSFRVYYIDDPARGSVPVVVGTIIHYASGDRSVLDTVHVADLPVKGRPLVRMVLDQLETDEAELRHPFDIGSHICILPENDSADTDVQKKAREWLADSARRAGQWKDGVALLRTPFKPNIDLIRKTLAGPKSEYLPKSEPLPKSEAAEVDAPSEADAPTGVDAPSGADTPSRANLDRLEALYAKGTKGPWRHAWTDSDLETRMSDEKTYDEVLIAGAGEPHFGVGGAAVMGTMWYDGPHVAGVQANCELICEAVNALPSLIAELRELRKLRVLSRPKCEWHDCTDTAAEYRIARGGTTYPLCAKHAAKGVLLGHWVGAEKPSSCEECGGLRTVLAERWSDRKIPCPTCCERSR